MSKWFNNSMSQEIDKKCFILQRHSGNIYESVIGTLPNPTTHNGIMSDDKMKCDNKYCYNHDCQLNIRCANSYQKSKSRRKRRRGSSSSEPEETHDDDSFRSCDFSCNILKGACFHETRSSFAENTTKGSGVEIASRKCIFDCNKIKDQKVFLKATNNTINRERLPVRTAVSLENRNGFSRSKALHRRIFLRHQSNFSGVYQLILIFLQFLILQNLIQFSRVDSFGHHSPIIPSATRLIMKTSEYTKYERPKVLPIDDNDLKSQKLIKVQKSNVTENRSNALVKDRMQSDSPFAVENEQEIWRMLR